MCTAVPPLSIKSHECFVEQILSLIVRASLTVVWRAYQTLCLNWGLWRLVDMGLKHRRPSREGAEGLGFKSLLLVVFFSSVIQ